MVSGGAVCIKYFLLILNLIFFILGICILYFGFSSVNKFEEYGELTADNPIAFVIVLIVIGFAVLVLSFFGCVGAFKENSCLLMTFCSIISVFILIELICIGFIYGFKSNLKDALMTEIYKKIDKYDTTGQSDQTVNLLIDHLQSNLKCCGAGNASDWDHLKNSSIPKSCCPPGPNEDKVNECLKQKAYEKGCADVLVDFLSLSVGTVVIATLICQFFAVIFACTLLQSIRSLSYGIA